MGYDEWLDLGLPGFQGELSYWEFRRQCCPSVRGYSGPFWEIIDSNWGVEAQSRLSREWKEGAVT